ncbi:S9 family peptidase [Pseudoalteromonas denitrificans]|nr:prolyl oligopeptidase family serine peptidase [Pseudoalteromonas denitrificans]
MVNKTLISLAVVAAFTLTACQTTDTQKLVKTSTSKVATEIKTPVKTGETQITLKQAMAHPDWLGRQPLSSYWAGDSSSVFYTRKQAGNELKDLFNQKLKANVKGNKVSIESLHQAGAKNTVFSENGQFQAYVFKGDVFVKNINTGTVTQVTRSSSSESDVQFLNDGSLVYREGTTFNKVNLNTGFTVEIANLKMSQKPKGVEEPKDYIAKEQHKLINFIALTHKNKKDKQKLKNEVDSKNPSRVDDAFYFGKDKRLVDAQLSPSGTHIIAVVTENTSWRADSDIMPNYIADDARVKSKKVRRRVADAQSQTSQVYILDLETGTQTELTFDVLPGFDDDVLAKVKTENYAREGKKYKSEKSPRAINLMMDWTWSQSAIQWNKQGTQAAVMLEAWDNKDRWIASVDFEKSKFVSQHRLHDDAWINYAFNDFGWFNHSDTLYFLSEESGYSQLYKKPLNGKASALTQGQFVISNLDLSKDDKHIYYKANEKHPGIYEVYRINTETEKREAITDLNGMTDFKLSPDESKLLLSHSKIMLPTELYVTDVTPGSEVVRLTNTVSDQFKNTQLIAPKVVAVASSHTEQPIYAKVYYPADYKEGESGKNRKAIIFNHGAGYLQNSHLGWSGYFREFMFHSLLASEGYVVMDMDYRASKGYGRDWRTAIYRNMGTPEIEDLADGIKWMQNNANVDNKRVGTYGGSYGGFMTFMALLTRPELFQAGAALRPVSDWAHYNDPYTSNILNRPDVDPIAYERSSPIYFAEGLQKNLLINAPMVDDNVFFQDVVRLVQRFIELEKENFETAIYPVEAHGFRQPSSWLDEYRRIYKLFKDKL